MKSHVVISMEQALTLPYATLRLVQQGWRVIKLEPTPRPGRKAKGDPTRYIGRPVPGAGDDLNSYFVGPNVGKESIAINLKEKKGQELLKHIIKELNVDVFCANTIPARHQPLGIEYETLRQAREDLIWCSISAMGTKYPDIPGYDPAIQALCGYMDITGYQDKPPLQCGPPIIDLKAGDEAFLQIIVAMMERQQTGKGKKIDISMAQVAVSWLHTFLPMLDLGCPPIEIKRAGNRHRQFIPADAYETSDGGFVYIAIGTDIQWMRMTSHPMFAELNQEPYSTNEGRRRHQADIFAGIGAICKKHTTTEITKVLSNASIPHSPVTPIEKVAELPFVEETALRTTLPDGRIVRLPPPAQATEYLEKVNRELPFAPRYGEQTDTLLEESGFSATEIEMLRREAIVA